MALDLASFESLFPAALIEAVATTPNGLTTAATQVYVGRQRRTSDRTSPEAWLRPLDAEADEAGLGATRQIVRYRLEISKDEITPAEQASWRDQVVAYFHGRRRPAATGLYHVRVLDLTTDLHEEEGPTGAVVFVLELHPR